MKVCALLRAVPPGEKALPRHNENLQVNQVDWNPNDARGDMCAVLCHQTRAGTGAGEGAPLNAPQPHPRCSEARLKPRVEVLMSVNLETRLNSI